MGNKDWVCELRDHLVTNDILQRAHHIKLQFSKSHFGHGLFDPLIVTFQGQTFFDRVINHVHNANLKIAFLYGGLFTGSGYICNSEVYRSHT